MKQGGAPASGARSPGSNAARAEKVAGAGTLQKGARGDKVRELQRKLGVGDDGVFGAGTEKAVKAFQAAHNLNADGVVGPRTWAALSAPAPAPQKAGGAPGSGGTGTGGAPTGPAPAGPTATPGGPAVTPGGPAVAGPAVAGPAVAGPAVAGPTVAGPTVAGPAVAGPAAGPATPARTPTPKGELKSPHHDDAKFVPKYAATATSESDSYRTKADPYAVGARTNPRKDQDDGGRTYGTYQFESKVYRDGSDAGEKAVGGSTLMRFVKWDGNPYGKELQEAVKKHGIATAGFDKVWAELTADHNREFGEAQEKFLEHDVGKKVEAFFDAAGVSVEARKDDRLYDVAIGTLNQYGSISNSIAAAVAKKQKDAKRTFTADEVGIAMQSYKADNVETNFKSSPSAHEGIRARVKREKAMFVDPAAEEKKEKKKTSTK